jgi:hypothetical protein
VEWGDTGVDWILEFQLWFCGEEAVGYARIVDIGPRNLLGSLLGLEEEGKLVSKALSGVKKAGRVSATLWSVGS